MVSEETLAAICNDVAEIFEASTNRTPQNEILNSEAFLRIKMRILNESPSLTDREIFDQILKGYSDRLRRT